MSKLTEDKTLKAFKIETFDGGGYGIFFTEAENHKKALRNLQTRSWDYKNCVNGNRDLTIKVIRISWGRARDTQPTAPQVPHETF